MATIAALSAISLIASRLPSVNPPFPIYGIVGSADLIPLAVPDSWGSFSARYESQVSDYPVETGAFALYNKVRRPQNVQCTLIKTGSDLARFSWLTAIQQTEAQFPTRLYTIVSPQAIFIDYTLTGAQYETRNDKGANMLYLTLSFVQVPQIESSLGAFSNVLDPKSSPVGQLGQLYTRTIGNPSQTLINAKSFILG
jgi:hypothetical protein